MSLIEWNESPMDGEHHHHRSEEYGRDEYAFAENPFLGFLASQQLQMLVDYDVVLFAGLTRVGKSSAVLVQRGSTFKKKGRSFIPSYSSGDPIVSDDSNSKTINVGVFSGGGYQYRTIKYLDSPGLDENRGFAYECWTQFSLYAARSFVAGLKSTVVVLNFRKTFEGTGDAVQFRKLALGLCGTTQSCSRMPDAFFNNMCFLMTNVEQDDTDLTIIPFVLKLFRNELKQLHHVLRKLATRTPQKTELGILKDKLKKTVNDAVTLTTTVTGAVAGAVTGGNAWGQLSGGYLDKPIFVREVREARREYQNIFEKRSTTHFKGIASLRDEDPDKKMFTELTASIQLLEAILKGGPAKLALSYPNGATLCKRQRTKVNAMIQECNPIGGHELKQMVDNQGGVLGNLQVYGIFAHMATQLTIYIENYIIAGNQIYMSIVKKDDVVRAIEEDWATYRDTVLHQLKTDEKNHQDEIKSYEAKIEDLQDSRELVAPPGYIYPINQSIDTWAQWFGIDRATKVIEHKGPFVDYEIEGKIADRNEVEKTDERLVVKVSGYRFNNLECCIKVKRYEKDTEQGKKKIVGWKLKIGSLKTSVENIRRKIAALGVVCTEEGLQKELVESQMKVELDAFRDAESALYDEKIKTEILHGNDDAPIGVTRFESARGLRKLLEALSQKRAFPRSIVDSSSMSDYKLFARKFDELEKVRKRLEEYESVFRKIGASSVLRDDSKSPNSVNDFDVWHKPPNKAVRALGDAVTNAREVIDKPLQRIPPFHRNVFFTFLFGILLLTCSSPHGSSLWSNLATVPTAFFAASVAVSVWKGYSSSDKSHLAYLSTATKSMLLTLPVALYINLKMPWSYLIIGSLLGASSLASRLRDIALHEVQHSNTKLKQTLQNLLAQVTDPDAKALAQQNVRRVLAETEEAEKMILMWLTPHGFVHAVMKFLGRRVEKKA